MVPVPVAVPGLVEAPEGVHGSYIPAAGTRLFGVRLFDHHDMQTDA